VAAAGVALSAAGAAHAEDGSAVDSAVGALVGAIQAAGDVVKTGLGAAEQGVEAAKSAYQTVAPAVQSAVDVAGPVLKGAVRAAAPVVEAGARAAGSAVSGVKPGLEQALASSGVDAQAVASAEAAAAAAVGGARPLLESLLTFVTTAQPATLAECALGLAAAYLLLPSALRLGAGALRGYAGDASPAAALDALASGGGAVLLDIRSAREKESAGVPDLGSNAGRLVELEFAAIEDRRVRGLLRDAERLEVRVTAMQAAALKRLSKGTPVYVMDRSGAGARAVAKELAGMGFGRVFVVRGGFGAWARDRLGVRLASTVSNAEVVLPGSGRFGTFGTRPAGGSARGARQLPPPQGRRALPGPSAQ
jgi:rhodanese-related sulfurtransferase